MKAFSGRYRLGILAAAIVLLAVIVFGPGGWLRWNHHASNRHFQAQWAQQASELLPVVKNSDTTPLHFLYQDLMRQAGREREVERQYKQWSSENPRNAVLQALYGRIVHDPGQRKALVEKSHELEPENDAAMHVFIEDLLNDGKILEAEKYLPQLELDHWLRWQMEARTAGRLGDVERTKQAYEKSLQDAAVPISVAIEYARFLTTWTDLRHGAIPNPFAKWGRESLKQEPLAFAYYAWLSHAPLEKTLEDLTGDLWYQPETLALIVRAILLDSIQEKEKAPQGETLKAVETLLRTAARIAPKNPEILLSLGLQEQVRENSRKAIQIYSTGLREIPSPAKRTFHERMGDGLVALEQLDLAAAHYQHAWGGLPQKGLFLKRLADLRLKEERIEEAARILEKTGEVLPRDIAVFRKLGDIYFAQNDMEKAQEAYNNIIIVDEHDYAARDKMVETWMRMGNPARAAQLYQALANREPENGYCYAQIARILLKAGQIDRADQFLKQKREQYPAMQYMDEVLKAVNEIELAKKDSPAEPE